MARKHKWAVDAEVARTLPRNLKMLFMTSRIQIEQDLPEKP